MNYFKSHLLTIWQWTSLQTACLLSSVLRNTSARIISSFIHYIALLHATPFIFQSVASWSVFSYLPPTIWSWMRTRWCQTTWACSRCQSPRYHGLVGSVPAQLPPRSWLSFFWLWISSSFESVSCQIQNVSYHIIPKCQSLVKIY